MSGKNTVKRKHIPTRSCAICHDRAPKQDLIRLVMTDNGLEVDPKGKAPGRGAYLCMKSECWERAVKSDALSKALKTTLTDEDRQCLRQAQPTL